MRLVSNWKRVLLRAYSVYCSAGSTLCGIVVFLDYLWPFLDGYLPISRIGFGAVGALLALAAIPSRVVVQDSVSGGGDDPQ